jgi:purine-binding chemotaxis protein CheW
MADQVAYLTFPLGMTRYALPVEQIDEVVAIARLDPVPGGNPAVLGALDVGGVVVPIADLPTLLAVPAPPPELDARILIVGARRAGLLVRGDVAVRSLPASTLRASAAADDPAVAGLVSFDDSTGVVLDAEGLLRRIVGVAA